MWGEGEVNQPRGSSPLLGNQRLTKASECCDSYVYVDALLLFSIDVVVHVSDASPLYTLEFNICCSTPLTFLPSESCTPFCTRSKLFIWYNRPTHGRLYYVVAAVLLRISGPGEIGELIWRRGSRSSTGTVLSQGCGVGS